MEIRAFICPHCGGRSTWRSRAVPEYDDPCRKWTGTCPCCNKYVTGNSEFAVRTVAIAETDWRFVRQFGGRADTELVVVTDYTRREQQ